jgi:hypothetical protein
MRNAPAWEPAIQETKAKKPLRPEGSQEEGGGRGGEGRSRCHLKTSDHRSGEREKGRGVKKPGVYGIWGVGGRRSELVGGKKWCVCVCVCV